MQMKEYWCQHFDYDDTRVIVLDFDGVLYSAPTYDLEYADYLARMVSILSIENWSIGDARKVLAANNIIDCKLYEHQDIRSICEDKLGILIREYDDYRLDNPFFPRKSKIRTISPEILKRLSQRSKLIIVSNDSLAAIQKKAEILGIDLSVFTNAYTPTPYDDTEAFDKHARYHQIINNYILHGTEIYAVGTNYYTDIAPLIDEFGAGLLADPTNCHDTEMFLEDKFLGGKNGFV